MARQFARIDLNIWDDPDFCALSVGAQRLYMMLLSYRTTNSAGMLPIQLTRWARHSQRTTAAALRQALNELATARFVVIDDATEELLIRSFIYHDGLGNWKHKKGITTSIALIESPGLRALAQQSFDRALADDCQSIANGLPIGSQSVANRLATDTPAACILEPSSFILQPAACESSPTKDLATTALELYIDHRQDVMQPDNPIGFRKALRKAERGAVNAYVADHPDVTAGEVLKAVYGLHDGHLYSLAQLKARGA